MRDTEQRGTRQVSFTPKYGSGPVEVDVRYLWCGAPDAPTVIVQGGISADRDVCAGRERAAGWWEALVAEGATIITQRNNKEFLERALNTPRTLLDDVLAKNPHKAKFETVSEKKVYSDGTRTVEMYHIYPAPHSNGLIVAYLPKEKVLFQGDFSVNPGQPANDHVKALVPALEKLKLVDFDRYINVHASAAPQSKADVWAAVGK